jgi:predicted nucleotidyltransferase
MNVSRPYGVISHPLDGAVLHVLAGTTQGLSGRRIAQLTGNASQEGARKALGRLVGEGVVEQQEAGNAILYRLNRRHLATPAIEQLTDLRRALLNRLTETFEAWEVPPLHASMFGSAARGDGDSASDIDLFVVRPADVGPDSSEWRERVERLAGDVRDWTGNHANIVEVSETDLVDLRRRRPAVIGNLVADALTLMGPDAEALLGERS